MSGVTAWAGMLCTVAAACAALQFLSPRKGMGRLFQLIAAAFFLCCLTAPLLSVLSIDTLTASGTAESSVTAEELEERVRAQAQAQTEAALKQTAAFLLSEYGISVEKVAVTMDSGADGRIYISGMAVTLDKQSGEKVLIAEQVLEKNLGADITVTAAP